MGRLWSSKGPCIVQRWRKRAADFSFCLDNIPGKSSLRKEASFTHSLRVQSTPAGKAELWERHATASHIAATVRKQGAPPPQHTFLCLLTSGSQPWVGFPTSVSRIQKFDSCMFLEPINLATNVSHHKELSEFK